MQTRAKTIKIFTLFILLFCSSCSVKGPKPPPEVEKGFIDLSNWNFSKKGNINLSGEWQFFPGKLLHPLVLNEPNLLQKVYIDIKTPFLYYSDQQNQLKHHKTVTYFASIKLPKKNLGPLSIRIHDIHGAYSIWINGSHFYSAGQVSLNPDQEISIYKKGYRRVSSSEIPNSKDYLNIIIQNSFHNSIKGGMARAPEIGLSHEIIRGYNQENNISTSYFLFIFMTSFFFFVLYLVRTKEKDVYWVSFFFGSLSLKLLFSSFLIAQFVPEGWELTTWELCQSITFICWIFLYPSLFQSSEYFLSKVLKISPIKAVWGLSFFLLLLFFFLPKNLFFIAFKLYETCIFMFLLALLALTLFKLLKQQLSLSKEGYIFFFGFFLLSLISIFNMSSVNETLTFFGIFGLNSIFTLMYLFFITSKYMLSINQVESLSGGLQREVFKQTRNLEKEREKAVKARDKIKDLSYGLEKEDHEKNQILQNISHELRTPLTLILGPVKEILLEVNREERTWVKGIEESAKKLLTMVNYLLELQKALSSKEKHPILPNINLDSLIRQVDPYFKDILVKKKVDYLGPQTLKPQVIKGDDASIQKILFYFFSHFSNRTKGNSSIQFFTEDLSEGKVRIGFLGKNLKEQHLDFKSYLLKDASQDQNIEDVEELGLVLSKVLAQKNNIGIWVEKKQENQLGLGLDFKLMEGKELGLAIPSSIKKEKNWMLADRNQSSPDEETNKEKFLKGYYTILVCDHNPDLVEYLKNLLANENYRVFDAANLEKAQDLIIEKGVDLLVCDLILIQKDDFEAIRKIRNDSNTSTLPIVLLSTGMGNESKGDGLRKGADAFLTKPFHPRELLAITKNLLSLKEQEKRYRSEILVAGSLQDMIHQNLDGKYAHYNISSYFKSSGKVGGDFMVVEDLGQELIFISQCDLCGHGLTASLLSFYLKGMMEHYLSKFRFNLSTEDLLKGLSNTLDRLLFDTIGGGYFSTFFFGILDSAHSSLKYINGGHPPAILLNGEHKLSPIISNGPPLGFIKLKGQEIDVKELDFLPGEKLIICSDSLMELPLGSESEILGKEKYLEICQKGIETGQVNNAESLANLFLKATKNDGFNDDCSIFLVEYED